MEVILRKFFLYIKYFAQLIIEIARSSHSIMYIIIFERKNTNPVFSILDVSKYSLTEFQKNLLTNSITLTPGTLSVKWQDELLLIHSISRKTYDSFLKSNMIEKISRL